MRPARERGFSLLELMVVVALVGLAAAMIIPNLGGGGKDSLDEATQQLRSRMAVLADRSLVRGELIGVRLEENRLSFLRYDFDEGSFLPLGDDEQSSLALEDSVRLEWQLQDNDSTEPDLAAVVEQRLGEDVEATEKNAGEEGEEESDSEFPQLFFFPSGEATPATLWLRNPESERQVTLELDSIGRLRRPEKPDGET